MRYKIKTREFVSQRCQLKLDSMEAWSYDWWQFVAVIGGEIYFNNARYSMQTSKHQSNVRQLLNQMGVKYKSVYIRAGLQNIKGKIANLNYQIGEINRAIANPKSQAKKNKARLLDIKSIQNSILRLEKLKQLKEKNDAKECSWPLPMEAHGYIDGIIKAQRAGKAKAKPVKQTVRSMERAASVLDVKNTGLQWPTLLRGGM